MAPATVQHENTHSYSFSTEIANGKHQNPPQLINTVPSKKEQGNHDFVFAEFSMDQKESEALTSSSCNGPLDTKPVELVIAAGIDAFKVVFSDVKLLTILCEANTDTDDLTGGTSRKVYPLTLHQATKAGNGYRMEEDLGMGEGGSGEREEFVSDEQNELKDTIMVVKNAYRRDPAEEWKSSQYGEQSMTMLFKLFNSDSNEFGGNDIPRKSNRLPLTKLEIAPVLEQGILCVKIKYLAANKRMQENIVHWIASLQMSLRSVMHLTQMLEQSFPQPILQDYPLLQIHTEAELETVMEGCRAQLQARQLAEIEDIFPCTPMQEGILVAQSKAGHLYKIRATWEVIQKYKTIASLDLSTLHEGWHEVVQRHQMLRTVFVQARVGKRSYLQVALKSSMPGISPFSVVAYETESHMMKDDEQIQLPDLDRPQHHFRICQIAKSGRVFYRLYLNHAVMDGFSASIFFRDLMQALDGTLAYQAQAEPYKSFVRYLSQQDHHASLSFWNDLLSGVSACKFPSFSSGYLGAPKVLRRQVAWTATQTSTIRRVCKNMGISPASFFRSIWALVLQCYTGSDDVCFGTMSSGRLIPVTGSIGIVGPMIANVTCRAQMTTSMSIETLFKTMMKDYGRSLPFQHCSVAEIAHSQGLGSEPLFNTVVNFMAGNAKDDVLETALCTFKYIESSDTADYDIILGILDDSTNMSMSFNSWRSFLREDEADCIIGTFNQAIASVVADPAQAIGGLNIFSPEDTSKVQTWSTFQLPDIGSTIHEQVGRQAASSPGKMAVCSTSLNLTYEELESLSDRLARVLVGSGVGKGAVVPFCMEKSVWATVAMLGVVKAGAAFVPLEPSHPIARLEWFIEELKAEFVLCSREALGKVQVLFQNRSDAHKRLEVIVVEDVTSRVLSVTTLLPSTKGSDTAYIIFTSGSTGKPKGVVVTHQAACGSIAQCAKAFRIDSKSRVLQFSAYTWDAILCEIFSTLDRGGTIFVPNEIERIDGLVQFLKKNKLNWLFLTPTVLRLIDPEKVHQKLTIVTIGELLGQDLIDSWHSKAVLINAYGPTESCVACVSGVVEKGASSHFIGKPFGSRAWVVLADDHNRLSPLGSIGELLIEGPNLAQGYFNDTQKTAMSFPRYPRWATQFSLEASSRFYKTGDLVRQNIDDGSLMFLARKDAQTKINGQRVELGEVEHHLLKSKRTSIRDAITMVPSDGPWKSKLVAVLSLPDHGNSTSKNSIPLISPSLHNNVAKEIFRCRRKLEDNLPAYMVPTFWVPLTQLPVLDSGKIDRSQISRWLCEPDENSEEQIQAWVASIGTLDEDQKQPMTLAQVKLRRIWAHVLRLPEVKVSIDKPFLNLGGDSIMAVSVATQSRAAGIAVTVQDLLRRKTIKELVSSAERDIADVQEHHTEQAFELSPTQALYVAADQAQLVHPGLLINLIRPVNYEVVLAAVKILVGRHPMLLARFQQDQWDNSKWTQRIADDVQDSWIYNIHQLDSVEDIQIVYASSQSDVVAQPGPVLSVNLIQIQCRPPSTYILLTANALIVDVESWRIIFDDLVDILQTGAPQQPASMPFRDWISQQAIMPVATLPTEPTSQHWGLEAGYQNELALASFSISQEETEALMTSCNAWLRTEPSDLIIAAVIYAFELVFTDQSLPMVFSERDVRQARNGDVDIARTVGLFTKIFPFALQPSEQQHESVSSSLKETLMKVKDSVLIARRANWSLQATSSHHKPMDIIFRAFSTLQRLGGDESIIEATVMTVHRPTTSSLAIFEFSPSLKRGSLVMKLSYPACIPMREEISKWMEHCKNSVEEIIRFTRALMPQPTLQSYPLLRLNSYVELDKVTNACQLQLGLRQLAEIEDIYPCSPMQEGILLAEAKTSLSVYDQRLTWRIKNRDVDLCKLQDAWQALVDRHTMLRTVFIEYPLQDYHAAQVVLSELKANVSVIKCKDVEELQMIQAHRPEMQSKVLHDLVICETQSGDFYCVLSFNHLLGDATSLQIIVQELQLAYGGHLESTSPSSYGDFISYLSHQNSKEVHRYWETFLAGVEACAFQKLTDVEHNKAHPESSSISQLSINLTARQISGLQRLSTESGITIAMVSNTIWAVVLHTFLSREDVCFGYLASGRDIDLPGVENMLGPLVTLLVCSLNIRPTMRLLDLAQVVQDNYVQSLSAQHYSLAEVYHSLGLQGEHLFNTVINVIPTQAPLALAGGKQYTHQILDMVPVKIINPSEFDIALDVIYSDSEAKVVLNYQREYLSKSLASSVIATISRILDALLENSELQVGQLKLCDELQQQSMSTWEPSDDIESRICLHESIEQRTKENPNAEAVCAHDGGFSYSDVWALSNQLAHRLVDLGVGPNICVPFCFEKSKWAVIAIIGILKAGGCCVPLDPSYPEARLQYMVDLTNSFVILASEEHIGLVKHLGSASLVVSKSFFRPFKCADRPPVTGVRANDPCYIIFSSGTTGEPKGSVLEHQSIQASSRILDNKLSFGRHSRVLQFSSYVFDVSIEEVVCTLMFGGCVCIPLEADRLNNLALSMEHMRVNWVDFTPTVLRTLAPAEVPHLRTLCLGGELLGDDLIRIWSHSVDMFNIFGPSECSITLTSSKKLEVGDSGTNIGRGYKCRFWIVDPRNHHVLSPIGAIGEMLVEGGQVGREYYKNPLQTAAAFIKNPQWASKSSSNADRRMYKTGDLARFDQLGNLVYLGRKDQQVKIRGQRVELMEIEFHLARYSEINSAVAAVPSTGWGKGSLVAVVILSNSKHAEANQEPLSINMEALGPHASNELVEISAALQRALPRHMVPSTIIPVYSLPLLLSGKVNRRAIKQWLEMMDKETGEVLRGGAETADLPSTELEAQIQAFWSHALDLPLRLIGVNVSFLSLGGDSISAMKVASLSRASGINITVQDLLQRKTISKLALSTEAAVKNTAKQEETLERAFKLTPMQSLQLAEQQDPFGHSLLLRMTQHLEIDAIYAAIHHLVNRHSMLRARFWQDDDGQWKQRLVAGGPESWTWRIQQLETFEEIHQLWAENQIDTSVRDSPVFSADLIQVEGPADYILLTANRLVIDAESWRIIFEDLGEILETGGVVLQPSPLSYQAWADRRPTRLDISPSLDEISKFWGSAAFDAGELQASFSMNEGESESLMTLCNNAFRTTPIELIMAAMLDAFERVFNNRDVPYVFKEGSSREDSNLDMTRTVGRFTIDYPISIQHADTALGQHESTRITLVEMVKMVKDACRSHGDSSSDQPIEILFRTFNDLQRFARNHTLLHVVSMPSQQLTSSSTLRRSAVLEVSTTWEQGSLAVHVSYPARSLQQEQIAKWIRECQASIRTVIHLTEAMKPEATLQDYPLLQLPSYAALDEVMSNCHSQLGVCQLADIEDIYPCSPMQEGMLLAQSKSTNLYNSHVVWRVMNPSGKVDIYQIQRAWQALVQRYQILRTQFIEASGTAGTYLQVVLSQHVPRIRCLQVESVDDICLPEEVGPVNDQDTINNSYFTLYQTAAGGTYIRLAVNHAIYDGDSFAILVKDFILELNDSPFLEGVPLYRDFIAHLVDQQPKSVASHWQDQLAGVSACKFPVLRSFDFTNSTYDRKQAILTREQVLSIRQFCRGANVTLSTFFRAIWMIILRSFTGSDETCFGTVASGRDIPVSAAQEILGPMITLTVCRTQVDASLSFLAVVESMQNSYLSNLPFQHASLAKIHHNLGLRGGEQLFNTIVNFLGRGSQMKPDYDKSWTVLEEVSGGSPVEYDLTLTIEELSTTIAVSLDYWSSCISVEQADSIMGTLCQAITSTLKDPQQKISEVTLLSPADASRIKNWYKEEMNYPVADTIHGRIERQAVSTPAKLAVCSTILTFTYKELNDLANCLAYNLIQLGIGQGSIVPFCMDKSVWPIVAMLGVLKTGAAFVPLDPSHPPSRLSFLVNETDATVLLCSGNTYAKAQSIDRHGLNVVVVENVANTTTISVTSLAQIDPSETAYVIFTSGSTGIPKGVVMSHQAACLSLAACAETFQLDNNSRSLQFSAYTWDAMVCEIYATLNCGGTVFVPNESERMNSLVNYIEKESLNWLFLTPTVLRLISPTQLGSQRLTIVTIGELLGRDLIERWCSRAVLINAYGPTETCVACTASVIQSVDKTSSNDIGKPFGCRAWVTVPGLVDCLSPIGSVGELVIEGPNLATGYYRDVKRTKELFIDRPQWAIEAGYRFYKTGDLVRQNLDGSLIFMGRKDTQVKIHGQRVELEEVEHHLSSLESVEQAVALAPREGLLKGKLVAVFSTTTSYSRSTVTVEESAPMQALAQMPLVGPSSRSYLACGVVQFRKKLEEKLPVFMVPTLWVPVTHLPLLSSGKTDRFQIHQWLSQADADVESWAITDDDLGQLQLQPATLAEFELQRIWADVLNLPVANVGTDRSFLSLGGDSISAMKVAWQSRADDVAVTVTVQDLLRRKTIVELALIASITSMAGPGASSLAVTTKKQQYLKQASRTALTLAETEAKAESEALHFFPLLRLSCRMAQKEVIESCCSQLGIQQADIEDIYPCSPVQEGILIAQARSSKIYDQRLTWKISSPITDTHQTAFELQKAWQELVNRHAILRTAFIIYPLQEHHFVQVVLRHHSAEISQVEIEEYRSFDSSETLRSDLHNVPHHLTILKTQKDVFCTLDFNHALSDATSVQIMIHELCLAYDGHLESDAPSYASFISHLECQDPTEVQLYWESALSAVEACTFPKQGNTKPNSSSQAQECLKLNTRETTELYQLCSKSEITIAALSNTLWAVVLSLFLGREDVCFGYLASGRDIDVEGIQHMLGPLVTLLVCHMSVSHSSTQSFLDLARMIQDSYLQSLPTQHYSLAEVYHALGMQGERLFNTVVNVLYSGTSTRKPLDHRALSMIPVDAVTPSEFDISLDVVYTDTEATINLSYNSDYLSKSLASSVMTTIARILDTLLANPTIKISELEVCNESQQVSLSDASESIMAQTCLHEVIKRQTLDNSQAQAVCAHDGDLSYQKLWTLTNRLAHNLIALGVKPNIYVPFCFEKSMWSIVAILSILKAGGCCVPLDPCYPKSRLQYMVNLVDATVVLTSAKNVDLVRQIVANPLVVDQAYFATFSDSIDDVSPVTLVQPNDAAYIIFTSGTTGEPKASVLEHQSIEAFSHVLGTSLNVNAHSRVLQFASFVFDLSIEEILGTLMHGGCVCIPSEGERVDHLASTMEKLQVNWTNLTPTVLRTLTPASVPHLRTVVSAGEALGDDLVKTWASIPSIDMFNIYGPSECTVAATISRKIKPTDSGMNIGKGRSCRIWIANPTNHHLLCPVGAVGEILIEGRQVGRGYIKSTEQTAAAFITDPAWCKTSSGTRKMYKSGDLARFEEDGSLVYLGRKDQQIKIRGHRVELSEIEYHLGACSDVRSATVVVPPKGLLTGRLVAIVVLATSSKTPNIEESQVTIAEAAVGSSALVGLSASLEQALPRHMIPSLIIPILSLPLLVSGKVNRGALNHWLESIDEETSKVLVSHYETDATDATGLPSNDTESQIQDIFSQILNLPLHMLDINRSFFSLGGDSILAMQMSSRLWEVNMKVSVQDIFEQKTITKLATIAQQNSNSIVVSPIHGTHPGLKNRILTTFLSIFGEQHSLSHLEDAFPCSSIQENILTAQVLEPEAWTAIMHFKVELQLGIGSVEMDVLEDAWIKVVNHHTILRTVFVPMRYDNVQHYGQVVLNNTRPSVVRRGISDAEASTLSLLPVALPQHLPAHQLTIMQTFSGEILISLQISHALYDATALLILFRDLRLAYEGVTLASSTPYSSYFMRTQLCKENSAVTHWKPLLEGYQAKAIEFAEASKYPHTSIMHTVEADITDIDNVYKYCKEQSMTIASLFQAIWAICLRDIARDDDICFGNMISGRELAGSEFGSVVGPCVNILPCRVRFSPTTTIHGLQKALKQDLLATLSHQHCSLEEIRQSSELRDMPLFETYINVHRSRHRSKDSETSLSLQILDDYMFEQYQIVLYIDEQDAGINISLSYRSPLIPDGRAKELLGLIQHVMGAIIDRPSTSLAITI